MLEDGMKLLGPWPILQFMFGVAVLAGGVYMIFRGFANKDKVSIEDRRAEWAAYEQLKNIEENSFKIVEHQKTVIDTQRAIVQSVNQLTSVLWNREQR
jgi:hypothetical protein